MKKTFTKFTVALVAALGLLCAVPHAQAQLGSPQVVWNSANYTAALGQNANIVGCYSGTNNLSINTNIVDVSQYRYVGLGWRSQLTTSGTTTNTVLVEKTADNLWWDPMDRINSTSAGTTYIGYATNYDVSGILKLRITVLTAAPGTAPLTNSTASLIFKHGNQ